MQDLQKEVDALFPPQPRGTRNPPRSRPMVIPGYELGQEIGLDGMGVVYRATQVSPPRQVALKLLLPGAFADATQRQWFRRETELLALLRHPDIVPIHEVGEVGNQLYCSMGLVDGSNLARRLTNDGMSPRAAACLIAVLAMALDFVHRHGIVHGNLQPASILLAGDGRPKLSAFACRFHLASVTNRLVGGGAASYMAPEVALGQVGRIGPPADIFALGAVLYEMLAGRPPFANATELVDRLRGDREPSLPTKWRKEIPRDLETICMQCLQPEPHRRFDSAAWLAADLNSFLRGEPILARRPGMFERLWLRAHRQHRGRGGGMAGA
jgi:eukaryotic-like serine/threonine-protein kinase